MLAEDPRPVKRATAPEPAAVRDGIAPATFWYREEIPCPRPPTPEADEPEVV